MDPTSLALLALVIIDVIIANVGERSRPWRVAAYALTALLGLGSVALGSLYLALTQPAFTAALSGAFSVELATVSLIRIGISLIVGGIVSWVVLLPSVRRLLARAIPIRPESVVNAIALSLLAILLGQSIGLGGLGPQGFVSLTGQLTLLQIVFSEIPLLLIGLFGAGLLTRRSPAETWRRLGLCGLTWGQFGLSLAGVAGLLVLQAIISAIAAQLSPETLRQLEQSTRNLYSQLTSPAAAIVASVASGVSEEVLFRGAIQPRLGLITTAVVFGIIHSQYGIAYALISIGAVGLVLGVYRWKINTTAAIVVHTLYNLILFLFAG